MDFLTDRLYTKNGRVIDFDDSAKVFNLGCGNQRFKNVIGIDVVPTSAADIVHDLDKTPWPIPDSTADAILAFHFLEHVPDLPRVMEEISRISKPGTRVVVEVPYFRSVLAYQDPTHRRFFTTRTFDYFCRSTGLGRYAYTEANFELAGFWLGWPAQSRNPLKQMAKNFFKRHRDWYDACLSHLWAMDIVVFELVVKK